MEKEEKVITGHVFRPCPEKGRKPKGYLLCINSKLPEVTPEQFFEAYELVYGKNTNYDAEISSDVTFNTPAKLAEKLRKIKNVTIVLYQGESMTEPEPIIIVLTDNMRREFIRELTKHPDVWTVKTLNEYLKNKLSLSRCKSGREEKIHEIR